jgi:hypothetical protein
MDALENGHENVRVAPPPQPSAKQQGGGNPLANHRYFPLYLSNNERAVLYVPSAISSKDFDLLKKQIEIHLTVIQATSVTSNDGK